MVLAIPTLLIGGLHRLQGRLWGGRRWRLVEPHGKWGQCQDWSAGSLTQSPALGSVSHSLGCVPGGWTQGNRKTHARVFFVNLGPRPTMLGKVGAVAFSAALVCQGFRLHREL